MIYILVIYTMYFTPLNLDILRTGIMCRQILNGSLHNILHRCIYMKISELENNYFWIYREIIKLKFLPSNQSYFCGFSSFVCCFSVALNKKNGYKKMTFLNYQLDKKLYQK